jgi:rsbT co-antagonist protein RsbR
MLDKPDISTSLRDENELLRGRIAELEQALDQHKQAEAALQNTISMLREVINNIPYALYWKDGSFVYQGCNQRFANDIGITSPDDIIGKTDDDLPWQPGEADAFRAVDRQVMEENITLHDAEETVIYPDGSQEWFETYKIPLHSKAGGVNGVLATYHNVTQRKLAEATIRSQSELLLELSTPIIPISDDVLVMPLIGTIDTRRAQQVLEVLLEGIARTHAAVAILDITGVPIVDTQVANALIRAAQAVTLLGARVVLTGIRPEVAQTLVGLGVDLRAIVTRSTLQNGITYAMSRAAS